MKDIEVEKFRCDICNVMRLDKFISVMSYDVSSNFNLKVGMMMVNVSYCNDNKGCMDKAKKYDYEKSE